MPAIVSRQAAQPLENDKIKVNDRPPFIWKGGFSIGGLYMKKIIILLLALFVLTGCGRKEVTFDTTKEVTTAYTSEKLDVSDLPPITGMCGDEQYVYIAASPLRTDEKQKIYPEIYRIDKNNEVKQLSLPFEKEGTVYALSNISSSNEKSTFALLWRYQDQDGTAA